MKKITRVIRMARAYPKVQVHNFSLPLESGGNNERLTEAYTQLRTDYVLQQVWPMADGGVDQDIYDTLTSTIYVIASIGLRVVAGLRLTPVDSIEGSLSYSMWNTAECRKEFLEQFQTACGLHDFLQVGPFVDVTRLITEANTMAISSAKIRAESRIGLLKILARAASLGHSKEKTIWIFTTTQRMLHFMQQNHFHVTILAHGIISIHDEAESFLCMVRPQDVIRSLRRDSPLLFIIAKRQQRLR